MLKLLEIGLSSPEYVKIVCKVCESVWKSVWECMKLRILNVLTKTAPTIPQTPHTDLKYPYVPKMAIWTHCVLGGAGGGITAGWGLGWLNTERKRRNFVWPTVALILASVKGWGLFNHCWGCLWVPQGELRNINVRMICRVISRISKRYHMLGWNVEI